ncbi:hypothetical protein AB733_03075 [Photobacterium swingsii]|nr:hypothetical protein AB733_03075 [Photobacterium swingsii]
MNQHTFDDIGYAQWRNHIIKVDKNTSLVEGSIIDNLTCFQSHLNSAAFSLCENLAIKDKIDGLKNGFYTKYLAILSCLSRVRFYSLYW